MYSKRYFVFNSLRGVLCFGILLLYSGAATLNAQAKMTAAQAAILKTKVKAQAATTQTISSDFTQYKHLDFLSNDIESSGKLAYKFPNSIRWEYTKPFNYVAIFKNDMLYLNDNGNKNTMDMASNPVFKQLNQLITASIKGDLFDAEEFTVSYFNNNDRDEVHFKPIDPQFSEFIKSFELIFGAKGEVQEVKMIEPSDDYTHIIFSDRTVNQPISDAVFTQ